MCFTFKYIFEKLQMFIAYIFQYDDVQLHPFFFQIV